MRVKSRESIMNSPYTKFSLRGGSSVNIDKFNINQWLDVRDIGSDRYTNGWITKNHLGRIYKTEANGRHNDDNGKQYICYGLVDYFGFLNNDLIEEVIKQS